MTCAEGSSVRLRFILSAAFVGMAALRAEIATGEPSSRPLTSTDAFATTRFMPAERRFISAEPSEDLVSISPDGRRYVIRVVRGDPQKHGLWVDVLSGSLDSLQEAVPTRVAHLFSTGRGVRGYGGPAADSQAYKSPITWVDNRKVAFLFSDKREIRQVVTVDVLSKQTVFVTRGGMQVQSFDLEPNGTLVYLADLPQPPKGPPPTNGFVVPERSDAMDLAEGYFDGSTINSRAAHAVWFVQQPRARAERVSFVGRAADGGYAPRQQVSISPDGAHAILSAPAKSVPVEWDGYLGHTAGYNIPLERDQFNAAHADPAGVDAGDIRQLYLLDIHAHTATSLWDAVAPIADWRGGWSPNGRYVVLTPIPIPMAEQSEARADLQTVIFDVSTGEHSVLVGIETTPDRVAWINNEEFAVESHGKEDRRACYSFTSGGWQIRACPDSRDEATTVARMKVQVKQDLNTPPKLIAIDERSAEERVVMDPNPALKASFALGKVESMQGVLSTGEHWTASLTLPVHYLPGERFPLVIQCQGGAVRVDRFTLYGWAAESGLGPTTIAPYAAQVLAGRGVAVLEFNTQAEYGSPPEAETTQRAFEELANKIVADGVADPQRIGVSGFSRPGYFTVHALSHSPMRFAAGVVADNVDYSYLQVVLGNRYADGASGIGAPAFGAGLKTWLDRATGFNADGIHAPLLLIGENGGLQANILEQWEILSRLRQLHRPVEMYLMPEIDTHPSHTPQNPDQVIAVQERTVDWFDFWLNGHEMPGSGKAEQYERWRSLKRLQAAAAAMDTTSNGRAP
jgi:hypothetical protein